MKGLKSPKSHLRDEDEDEDEMSLFKPILGRIDLDFLPTFALSVRLRVGPGMMANSTELDFASSALKCKVVPPPLTGTYHIAFPLKFSDGVRWILKVPARGCSDHWCEISAQSLTAEARTMQLLKRKTTIPIPEIYAFDASLDNSLHVPFILMKFVDGISLHEAWFNRSVSPDSLEQIRRNILEELAFAMVQLNDFASNQCGSLDFDQKGDVVGVSPYADPYSSDLIEPSELNESKMNELGIVRQIGPFTDPKVYLRYELDSRQPPDTNLCRGKPMDRYERGLYKLIRIFIDWVPFVPHKEGLNFVLTFPDFSPLNVFVTEEGHLCGLIDWDGVTTEPRCIGCEAYPSWLTRDWDLMIYHYDPMVHQDEQQENSPEELAHYRMIYKESIQKALTEKYRWDQYKSSASDSRIRPEVQVSTSLTHNSLLIQNLAIAAYNGAFTFNILFTIFENIKTITASKWDTKSGSAEFDDGDTSDSKMLSADENEDSMNTEEIVVDLQPSNVMFEESTSQIDEHVAVLPRSAPPCSSDEVSHQGTTIRQNIVVKALERAISLFDFLVDLLHSQNTNEHGTSHDSPDQKKRLDKSESSSTRSTNTSNAQYGSGKQGATASPETKDHFPSQKNELNDQSTESNAQGPETPSEKRATASQPQEEITNPTTYTDDDQSQSSDEEWVDEPEPHPESEKNAYDCLGFEFLDVTLAVADGALDDFRMKRLKEGFMALLA